MTLAIVNIIATARIKSGIDVEKLNRLLPKAEYNPKKFSGLIWRGTEDRPTIIIFKSGKISSHGSKSEKVAFDAIKQVLHQIVVLEAVFGDPAIEWIRIANVVGVYDFKRLIDIESMFSLLPNSIYEPEQFPGLIYRPFDISITCLIFSSGKMIVAGAKSEQEIKRTVNFIEQKIETMGF